MLYFPPVLIQHCKSLEMKSTYWPDTSKSESVSSAPPLLADQPLLTDVKGVTNCCCYWLSEGKAQIVELDIAANTRAFNSEPSAQSALFYLMLW